MRSDISVKTLPIDMVIGTDNLEQRKAQDSMEKKEVTDFSNELTHRHNLIDRGKIQSLFQKMTIPEYIALHMIDEKSSQSPICSERTYLKDLSEKMQIPIRQASKMMSKLQERGLILWSHDGKGSEGTYVTITETGKRLLDEQEAMLQDFYGNVIHKFGKQNLTDLLQLTEQLETVMNTELEEQETLPENDRMDEW